MPGSKKKYKRYLQTGIEIPRATRYRQENRESSDDSDSADMKKFYSNFTNEQNNLANIQNESINIVADCIDNAARSSDEYPLNPESESMSNSSFDFDLNKDLNDELFDIEDLENISLRDRFDYDADENGAEYIDISSNSSEDTDLCLNAIDDNNFEEEISEKLGDILNNDNYNKVIDATVTTSVNEMLLAILKYSLNYALPNIATQDLCKMINNFLSVPVLPDTRYSIDKLLEAKKDVVYHAVCPNCEVYLKQFSNEERFVHCETCDSYLPLKNNNANYFIQLNIKNEIKNLLESNENYYHCIMNERRNEEEINDIYDGLMYKKFVESLPLNDRKSYATCIFNTDGSPTFKSSSYSIWPIQLILNEIPVEIRNAKPITFGLWFGKNKPKMNIFLNIFVKTMNSLSNEGISCKIRNEMQNIKLYAISSCVDSVARAPMQGIVQFNGYFGCNWCLHPGILVQQKKRKTIKYPFLDYILTLRTEEETIGHMRETQNAARPICGVKEASVLINLKSFDIIRGFVPDIMHCIALGVCRQFANYWFGTSGQLYSISKENIQKINKLLSVLLVPKHVARLSRPIKDRKYWKAREWDNWLLYYSLPILQEISNFEVFVNHWKLLVESLHTLMGSCITKADLIQVEKDLKEFVGLTELYYSRAAMTYNVHQVLHLCESVLDWGPGWAHIGYPFESGNGKILRMIKAAKGILHQVIRNINFKQNVAILQSHIKAYEDASILDYCNYLDNKFTLKSNKLPESSCRHFGKFKRPSHRWIESLELSENNAKSFHRMIKQNCLFSSCRRHSYRSNNSFAKLKNGTFILIHEFIVDEENNKEYTICKTIEVENALDSNIFKTVTEINETLVAVETNVIESTAIFMKIDRKKYICSTLQMIHY